MTDFPLLVIALALGASVGSFLNVVADRLPEGQSLIRPRSHCPSCKRPVATSELVPILSYLWLRGKCRECRAPIPVRVLWVEVGTGVLFSIVYLRFGLSLEFVVLSAAVSVLFVIAVIDLEHRLILNRIVLPTAIVLLVMSPFWTLVGLDRPFLGSSGFAAAAANSLLAGLGAFLLFLIIALVAALVHPAGMGVGDVKLAGLLGLFIGFPGVLMAVWVAAVTGGLVGITLLVLKKKGRKDLVPYGPFLSLGGIVMLLGGSDVIDGYLSVVDSLTGL